MKTVRTKGPARKNPASLPPIKVRHEPPTIAEALAAAEDLADDLDLRIEIAAGLMGISEEEVRPLALEAEAQAKAARPRLGARTLSVQAPSLNVAVRGGMRTVVVERKPSRALGTRVR